MYRRVFSMKETFEKGESGWDEIYKQIPRQILKENIT
jgi:hypothetical protein